MPGATRHRDLNAELVADFIATRKQHSAQLSQCSEDEILVGTGVLDGDGGVSMAGLLVLGEYPQQFFPTLMVQARIPTRAADDRQVRVLDSRVFDGPIPAIISAVQLWVAQHSPTAIRVDQHGGRDEPAYPAVAVREVITNALVHRDLGPHAISESINLVLRPDHLSITNPGVLFGLTVDTLGLTASHPRNHRLTDLATYVHTSEGQPVTERLGTGFPAIRSSLEQAGMQPALFFRYWPAVHCGDSQPQHAQRRPRQLPEGACTSVRHGPNRGDGGPQHHRQRWDRSS